MKGPGMEKPIHQMSLPLSLPTRLLLHTVDKKNFNNKELQSRLADNQARNQRLLGYRNGIATQHIVQDKPGFGPESVAKQDNMEYAGIYGAKQEADYASAHRVAVDADVLDIGALHS